jgi:hypothetical protein
MTKKANVERVGYKSPPRHTQFPPGKSGNSKGRPKGRKNLRKQFLDIIEETITVNENGRRRKLRKGDVALRQVVNKAMTGESRSVKLFFELLRQFVHDSDHEREPIHITITEEESRY